MTSRSWVPAALVATAVMALQVLVLAPATAADRGPRVSVTPAQLAKALVCSGPLAGLTRDPVLLTPAFSTGTESYGFGYQRQLPAIGITTCTLTLPDDGYGDLQYAAEYDVAAVRKISAASGRKVVLIGHQHGALDGLWALKFWPDLRTRVSDFVALATPFNGTTSAAQLCRSTRLCPASYWQISARSTFLAALSGSLPPGPSYTSIASRYDELIVPQPSASRLAGARNVVLQDVCPGRPVEHFTILADNVTYLLVLDALTHPGAADPSRLPAGACTGPLYLPGVAGPVGGIGLVQGFVGFLTGLLTHVGGSVPREPALRSYAR
ncbi:MAG: lipase [Marmoricola sp.]|nr:lipase [Marmoricola sp.]